MLGSKLQLPKYTNKYLTTSQPHKVHSRGALKKSMLRLITRCAWLKIEPSSSNKNAQIIILPNIIKTIAEKYTNGNIPSLYLLQLYTVVRQELLVDFVQSQVYGRTASLQVERRVQTGRHKNPDFIYSFVRVRNREMYYQKCKHFVYKKHSCKF